MTALYIDGFEDGAYATRYTSAGTISLIAGRLGTDSAIQLGAGASLLRAVTASAQLYVGFAYQAVTVGSSQSQVCDFCADGGTVTHISVRRETSGAINLTRNGTSLATSAAAAVPQGVWGFMEITGTIADAGGIITVRWNGVQIATASGDTKNAGTSTNADAVRLSCTGASSSNAFDDFYVFNALTSVNNTYAGDSRVQTLVPSAAGNTTQFTPNGSANNWDNVNELPYSATDYNASSTTGQKDTYTMANLLTSTTTVKCVQTSMIAHKSDAGTGTLKTVIRSGGTDFADSSAALGVTPSWFGTIRETDPATSAAWTVSGVNAAEAGAEVA